MCIIYIFYPHFTTQKKIENQAQHLCSVVYGSLPPETRTKQVYWSYSFQELLMFLELTLFISAFSNLNDS